MDASSRRFVAGLIRVALVVLAIVLVAKWVMRRSPNHGHVRVQTEAPPPDSLGAGDIRVFNADSSVDLILKGDKVLAGLSPKTVAKVRGEIERSSDSDSGIGGSIASLVKKTVAGAIGTHAAFPLADIRDVRYEDGRLIFDWTSGGEHNIFGNTKVDHKNAGNTFRAGDAKLFIDAVHARKRQLGQM